MRQKHVKPHAGFVFSRLVRVRRFSAGSRCRSASNQSEFFRFREAKVCRFKLQKPRAGPPPLPRTSNNGGKNSLLIGRNLE